MICIADKNTIPFPSARGRDMPDWGTMLISFGVSFVIGFAADKIMGYINKRKP